MLEGQVSEKRDEHSVYPDHYERVVHECGGWEPLLEAHCPNPTSRSTADPTPVSRNLAGFFGCAGGGWEIKVKRTLKIKIQTEL